VFYIKPPASHKREVLYEKPVFLQRTAVYYRTQETGIYKALDKLVFPKKPKNHMKTVPFAPPKRPFTDYFVVRYIWVNSLKPFTVLHFTQ
jgi:hypothetical protein